MTKDYTLFSHMKIKHEKICSRVK